MGSAVLKAIGINESKEGERVSSPSKVRGGSQQCWNLEGCLLKLLPSLPLSGPLWLALMIPSLTTCLLPTRLPTW